MTNIKICLKVLIYEQLHLVQVVMKGPDSRLALLLIRKRLARLVRQCDTADGAETPFRHDDGDEDTVLVGPLLYG